MQLIGLIFAAVLTVIGLAGGSGVGSGKRVTAQQGSFVATAYTDSNSQVRFQGLAYGKWDIIIHMPRTSPLFLWECRDRYYPIDQPSETVIINCVKRWGQ